MIREIATLKRNN